MVEDDKEQFYGREVILSRDNHSFECDLRPGVTKLNNSRYQCNRCATKFNHQSGLLPRNEVYCRNCIQLGRISSLVNLGTISEPNNFKKGVDYLAWQGQLTNAQQRCSSNIIESINQQNNRLLWAVTGAGKTEMLFEGVAHALKLGHRVCIASPRVDVCIELFPRLQAAFPVLEIVLLHGKTEMKYQYRQLTICTTHQLLRFQEAFDLLIIDEVDAFPLAGDAALHFAIHKARKLHGTTIYLTATPDQKLLNDVKNGDLPVSYLPRRFHGFKLPEIMVKLSFGWEKKINKGYLFPVLRRFLQLQKSNKRRFLIFVPRIRQLPLIHNAISKKFSELKIEAVHSKDPQRHEKVQLMRSGEVDGLLTTTILERGVTLPKIDILIIGSDDNIYSSAALVQIAGRAGRSKERPDGNVWAACEVRTKQINTAIAQIRKMNRMKVED